MASLSQAKTLGGIGSILATLIVLVGVLILFIAAILQIVAFFSIPEQVSPQMPPQQVWGPPTPPAPMPPSLTPAQ